MFDAMENKGKVWYSSLTFTASKTELQYGEDRPLSNRTTQRIDRNVDEG